jgi:hypothetical protein
MAASAKSVGTYYYHLGKNFPIPFLVLFIIITLLVIYILIKWVKKYSICDAKCNSPELYDKNKEFCMNMCK